MSAFEIVETPLSDEARGARLFKGALLVHRRCPETDRLSLHVDALLREAFAPNDPELAHETLSTDALLEAVVKARDAVASASRSAELFADFLAGVGADVDATFWDKLTLRVLPPDGDRARGPAAPVGFHRDTWASRIAAQVNWWSPIRAVERERTFAIYPSYFARPIANASATWDPMEYLRARGEVSATAPVPYPIVPLTSEPVDRASETRVVIDPGDVLAFSSAHLHASLPNTTNRVRFSIEVRTVSLHDLERDAGAPNVDGVTGGERWHWYRQIRTGRSLVDVLAG